MRRAALDQEGVSAVVGAILVIGLIVAITVSVRVNYVPIWAEDREAEHARSILNQLGALKSEIDREVDNRTTIAFSNPLDMGVSASNALGAPKIPDRIALEGPARAVYLGAPQFVLIEEDGETLEAFSETWSSITATADLEDVFDVSSLRLRVTEIKKANTGDDVTITVYDAGGAFAGDFKFSIIDAGGADFLLYSTVRAADGSTIIDNPLSQHNNAVLSPYWVDVTDASYRFDQVIDAADAPLTLRLTENGLDADFSATYSIYANGQIITAGGGLTVPYFSRMHSGPSLVYTNANQYFVPQEMVYEHGAIILDQDDAQTMRVEPTFTAGLVGNVTNLLIVVPTLSGTDQVVTGEGPATVYTTPHDRRSYIGRAPMFTMTVETAFPSVWAGFWTQKMLAIPGFVAGAHFLVSYTEGSASLQVYGTDPDAGSSDNDLYLTIRQATIQTQLRG